MLINISWLVAGGSELVAVAHLIAVAIVVDAAFLLHLTGLRLMPFHQQIRWWTVLVAIQPVWW